MEPSFLLQVAGESDVAFIKAVGDLGAIGLLTIAVIAYSAYQFIQLRLKSKEQPATVKITTENTASNDRVVEALIGNAVAMNALAAKLGELIQKIDDSIELNLKEHEMMIKRMEILEDYIAPRKIIR